MAVSPCNSFVFAAGQDNRVRAWSLLSGDPILSSNSGPNSLNLLDHQFADSVAALQVVNGGASGLTLWAASGKNIHRYGLGHGLGFI